VEVVELIFWARVAGYLYWALSAWFSPSDSELLTRYSYIYCWSWWASIFIL